MNEKIWRKQFLFAKPKILTLWCLAYCGVEFFELSDQIARQNRNRIRKRLSLFTRGPDVFEAWKNGGRKCRDALPLTAYASNFLQIILYLRGLSSRMGRFCPFSNFMHLQVVWGFPRYSPYCIQYGELPQKFILFQKHRRATPLKGPYLKKKSNFQVYTVCKWICEILRELLPGLLLLHAVLGWPVRLEHGLSPARQNTSFSVHILFF